MIRLLFSALLLGAATDFFLLRSTQPGIGFTLFILIFLTSTILATGRHKELLVRRELLFLGLFLAISSLSFTLFDSLYAQQVATVSTFFLMYLFLLASSGLGFLLPLEQYIESQLHVLETLPKSFASLRKQVASESSFGMKAFYRSASQVFIGLLVLIPVGGIFIALFGSADPVFANSVGDFLERLFSGAFLGQLLGHLVATPLFFFFWLIPLSIVRYLNTHTHINRWDARTFNEKLWVAIVFGGLVFLFGGFIGFQGFYLFGGDAAFEALDVTYADYAKQGFYELMVVAGLVLGLASIYHVFMRKQLGAGKILLTILFVETFVILWSSFVRLSLYVNAYGLTPSRHLGYLVLLIATISLLATIVMTWVPRLQRLIPATIFVIALSLGVVYPFTRPDYMIAMHNFSHASEQSTTRSASELFSELGADGLSLALSHYAQQTPSDLASRPSYVDLEPSTEPCSLASRSVLYRSVPHHEYSYEANMIYTHFDSFSESSWYEFNAARARLFVDYSLLPSWVRIFSSSYHTQQCSLAE